MNLGERLFSLRTKRGESLQQVADGVGVSKAHIWELEKGRSRNPSFGLVQRISAHFGVETSVLTGDSAEPAAEDLQLQQLNRDLSELSARDRSIIADMVRSMKQRSGSGD